MSLKSKSIYEYKDYKIFLKSFIESRPSGGHGEKSRIAAALQCHNAYLSQILQDKADLSLEQAFLLSQYLRLNADEGDYLLLLVQYARAGQRDLKKYWLDKIQAIESSRSLIKNRIAYDKKVISPADQTLYFSQWYFSVIHLMIATLKGFSRIEAIEKALPLSPSVIIDALQFLEKSGLIQKEGEDYLAGQVNIHLENDAAMIAVHHSNWRMQAIRSLEKKDVHELHYSSAVTVYEHDFEKVKSVLLNTVEQVRAIINEPDHHTKSKSTTVAALTLDWFKLI